MKRVLSAGKRIRDNPTPTLNSQTKTLRQQSQRVCRGLRADQCRLHDCHFILCEPLWAMLSDCVGLVLLRSFTPPAPTVLFPPLLWDFPKLHLIFRCDSLNLLPSAAGGNFSDDYWTMQWSMRIALLWWLTFIIYYFIIDFHFCQLCLALS